MNYLDDSVPQPEPTYLAPTTDVDLRFGLLPEPEGRAKSFLTSAVTNVIIFAILLLLTVAALKHKEMKEFVSTQLVLPENTPPPPKPKPPVIKVEPPKIVEKPLPPKIEKPPEPPKPVITKMEQPKLLNIPAAPPKSVPPPPPPPKVGLFTSAAVPTPQANNMKAPTVKTGGFGDPVGVAPNPNAKAAANIASAGAFDMPKGEGVGAGHAGKGSVKGVSFGTGVEGGVPGGTGHGKVAVAGFSNGIEGGVPGGTGTGRGTVKEGGFGSTVGAAGPAARPVNNEPLTTQIEVLSKPDAKLFYTPEARNMRIEGEVVLRIRVDRDGHAEFIEVVRGLGHGLDEAAIRMLGVTRFKPAYANGQPVDKVTTYRVTFQLA
jgi:TonB family protein